MKDTYRERIKEEQKKLSPSQVFFSEGYRKLFRDLANEVAGEKLEQLLLYQSTEDGLAGWNDGKRIGINIGNLITGSFLELEQKSDSLIGILGHECGHARFTDSALRKVYVQNMLAGVWYPDAPEPENEDEEKALNEMDTCLAGKNPVVVPLLTECASYISNLLNDVYIEEKMCSLFPGSIKKGILINRRRNVEWIPPLKELLEGNSDPVSVFLKVLVQYALRGYANSWNMESCEMLDTLNEVKHFVDLSVTADSDLIRYQATNQILLKMWKYFRNLLEELKQECKEPEENEEEPPQEEEPSEAEMSQEEPSEKEPAEVDEPPEEPSQKEPPQEEPAEEKRSTHSSASRVGQTVEPLPLSKVEMTDQERFTTGIGELDRVLGGGIVPASLVLVGGDPGIGKSTLLLQVCRNLAEAHHSVLYISGEESMQQIKIRAERIGSFTDDLELFCETNLSDIASVLRKKKPRVVVIDSIQTMYSEDVNSAPGSVSQVRQATALLLQLAKSLGITIFIVGHVTKEGVVAGPRVLEHMVDTVLYFEGDRHAAYRILRGVKNRFGSTNEIGVFEMQQAGLVEVKNPSEYMLNGRPEGASGSIVTCSIEGTRPILLEIQALVCKTGFGLPRRTAAGADLNRVNLLMAVLEKRAGMPLSSCDAYVNIAGGIRMNEPAIDLGIVLAIVSSYREIAISDKTICFGEVGLSGEVRAVNMAKQRVQEAKKLGFETCILPKVSLTDEVRTDDIQLIGVSNVREAISRISG